MLIHIERRLDNVAHRVGMGVSRPQSRQIVNHGHLLVNGRKVDIASFEVSVGDVISVRERSKNVGAFDDLRQNGNRNVPKWLELDASNLTAKVVALPEREDITAAISEHLIVELYSK